MTDRPKPRRPEDGDPSLDDTQPVEVGRYEPARERPAPGWTSGAGSWLGRDPHATTDRTSDRWWEPTPIAASAATAPVVQQARGRRGGVLGPVVATSLLTAVLASGGTVLFLNGTGALDHAAAPSITPIGTGIPASAPQSVHIDESSAVIDAASRVSPAVVRISVAGAGDFDGTTVPATGVGSGVIYHPDGWIVTNRHVVQGGDRLTVELKDGRQFQGRIYGTDTLTDLAVVKVDAQNLPSAELGSADGLKVGQRVVAIGSPLGTYSFSVTSGIVSGKGRSIQVASGERLANLIQTDAAINPGNSGGPLVDVGGTIVGINTAIASEAQGIGFAIPIDIARPILEQATRGEQLSRPWIGIRFESIDLQLKERQQLPVETGALVSASGQGEAVVKDSPAASAGLKEGDIITAIEGMAIDQEHPLDALLVRWAPGRTITLRILRQGAPMDIQIKLGTRPANL
jgi:serine protease Do